MRPCEGGRPATWGVASPMLNWGVCWVLAFLFLPAIPLSAHITIPETSRTLNTAGEIAQAPDSASMESGAPEVPQVNIAGLPRETQDQVAEAYAAARKQPRGVFTVTDFRYDDGRRNLRMPLRDLFKVAVMDYNRAVFNNERQNRVPRGLSWPQAGQAITG